MGFRDLSRIIKIEKATGRVVDSWGLKNPHRKTKHSVAIHQQHDANILDDGTIAVFNNNDYPGRDSTPSAFILSQQATDTGNVIWRFNCGDSINRKPSRSGGNIDELKNGNLLICMGNLDRILEVTRDKKVVWEAEIKPNEKRSFSYFHRLYRAHCISSLYPCYFTVTTNKDTVSKNQTAFTLQVFNKGSEADAYDIKTSSSSGGFNQQFSTETMMPNSSASFKIKPSGHFNKDDQIEILINSKINPDFERKQNVVVK